MDYILKATACSILRCDRLASLRHLDGTISKLGFPHG